MKYNLFSFFLALSISFSLFAQERKEVSHYIFPEFVKGVVLMKNGTKNPALLNFNAATEEMVFDQNGQMLAIADVTLNQLDTVFIKNRKFILVNKKFMEVLHNSGYGLFAEHKCRIIPPGKPAAYGGTSQTSSADTYSSWSSDGRVYKLQLPDDYKVKPYTVYWFRDGSNLKSFTSIGQIKKFFNKKKGLYEKYTTENAVDFEDQAAIVQLFRYMKTN